MPKCCRVPPCVSPSTQKFPDLPRLWAGTRVRGPCLGCCQRNDACPDAWSLCWEALCLACLGYSRWCLAQILQRVWFGMGGGPASYTDAQELGLIPSFLGAAAF